MSYSPLTPLDDRVAIVTGGARGIGLESAKALKENGAKVVIVDLNAEAGEKAAKDLDIEFALTDLTKSAEVAKLASDIRSKHGRIDIDPHHPARSPLEAGSEPARPTADVEHRQTLERADGPLDG